MLGLSDLPEFFDNFGGINGDEVGVRVASPSANNVLDVKIPEF